MCLEVDEERVLLPADRLTGTATIQGTVSGDITSYTAFGLLGRQGGGLAACVADGGAMETCEHHYDPCSQEWSLTSLADGAPDPASPEITTVQTRLTFVTCSQDLASSSITSLDLELTANDITWAITLGSWASVTLGDIGLTSATLGNESIVTTISSSPGGFVIGETLHVISTETKSTTVELTPGTQSAAGVDKIQLPRGL